MRGRYGKDEGWKGVSLKQARMLPGLHKLQQQEEVEKI